MVEHIGFDSQATNASDGSQWSNPPLKACPALPEEWPDSIEHPECVPLWQMACATQPVNPDRISWLRHPVTIVRKAISKLTGRVRALR